MAEQPLLDFGQPYSHRQWEEHYKEAFQAQGFLPRSVFRKEWIGKGYLILGAWPPRPRDVQEVNRKGSLL